MARDEDITARRELLEPVAADAGARALAHWRLRDALVIEEKADPRDIVSAADREVETVIRARVAAAFPDDGFLGEELGVQAGRSGYTWVIDPIDGTVPFLYGQPSWCVSIAVADGDRPVAGAIAVPVLGELFVAQRGAGAWLDGRPLRLAGRMGIGGSQTGIGANYRTDPAAVAGVVERLLRRGGMFYRNGSGALMLAYVASGRLAGYFEPHMHAWDCLAGLLIIDEAGGRTGPYPNGALTDGGRVIAAAPGAWEDLVAVAEGA